MTVTIILCNDSIVFDCLNVSYPSYLVLLHHAGIKTTVQLSSLMQSGASSLDGQCCCLVVMNASSFKP